MAVFKVTGTIHSTDGWIYTRTHVTEAISEAEAKNHFAWHFVVRKNPNAEFPFGKIDFKNIKVMKGKVKMEHVSLWKILQAKLAGRNLPVTDAYAKALRKQFKVYKTNIDNEKLVDKIAEYVNNENKKKEAKAFMEAKEESENMGMIKIIVNMLLKHGATVDYSKDKNGSCFVYTRKGECEIVGKSAILMARDLYKKVNILFNQFQANYFKGELIKLFKPEGNDNVVTCAEENRACFGEGDGHINQAFLDGIDSSMENQDHVLDSTWSQRKFNETKTELPKEPANMYPAHLYDPVNQREEDCIVRFMRVGDKFLGTICFRPEGWKTFSDVRGDFKNRFKTIWEFEPKRYKSPIIRIRKQVGKDDIYGLGGNEGVDATLRTVYKILVQWQKDEIKRREAKEAKEQYYMNRRYVDGGKK